MNPPPSSAVHQPDPAGSSKLVRGMNGRPMTRLYTLLVAVVLGLQGVSTLTALTVPVVDAALPVLLEQTQMTAQHSVLHILTAALGGAALQRHGARAAFWFALALGSFYTGLALVGMASGSDLCLGLKSFDHPFHLLVGLPGLVCAGLQLLRERAAVA
jgi:hypothetical protein